MAVKFDAFPYALDDEERRSKRRIARRPNRLGQTVGPVDCQSASGANFRDARDCVDEGQIAHIAGAVVGGVSAG